MSSIEQALRTSIVNFEAMSSYCDTKEALNQCKSALSDIESSEAMGWIKAINGEGNKEAQNTLELGRKIYKKLSDSSPISKEAYDGAREDLAIWKKRALEAEKKVSLYDQRIIDIGAIAMTPIKSPQQREWVDIDLSEYENQGLGGIAEEICEKLKQLNKG